jgi:hypothetical protein
MVIKVIKIICKSESFQHYYVFVTQINIVLLRYTKIYINLTFKY